MKVSAVNMTPRFTGNSENSKKTGTLKNAAGAAAIAIAAAVPAQEAEAQYYVPVYPHNYYYMPAPVMNVPNCFIYGDIFNEDYEKTLPDVFSEIDSQIQENGQISVNEVVALEENNWNATHTYPMSRGQKTNTANMVKNLSRNYNDKGSNPNTINYNEYSKIMKAYMQSKNAADLINLLQIIAYPYPCHPHYHHPRPHHHEPPHHHRR